jgi:hypothetical protein
LRYYAGTATFSLHGIFGLGEFHMNIVRVPSTVQFFASRLFTCLLFTATATGSGCGPSSRGGGGDKNNPASSSPDAASQAAPDAYAGPCVPQAEATAAVCSDGRDNDCDGISDCSDPDCSGIGSCPVCGTVQRPLGMPLPLPDGVPEPGADSFNGPFIPYTSKLTFTGFGPNQVITRETDLQYVCATMEHSWIRDLQIELRAPSGEKLVLQQFGGRDGGQVFFGEPNPSDDTPVIPGVGYRYCWSLDASRLPTLDYADANPFVTTLPAGSYKTSTPWRTILGAKLNGDWTFYVRDDWQADNGSITEWSIAFDPTILTECPPPVE